ncbi:helix-turn-helix domain-containing protein, partial [Candidatus Microgenomates bacterium]|nr:helix-turn-helix domain-containing protein [Candidatus Microgenomates bacterium]
MAKSALSPKQRLKLLDLVYKQGMPISSACTQFGVSRVTFYKWEKRYNPSLSRKKNLKELADSQPQFGHSPFKASRSVEDEVKRIATENPSFSKYIIAQELQKIYGKSAVGTHGVYNILRRTGLNTKEQREEWRNYIKESKKRSLTPSQRLELVERVARTGVPIAVACRDFGVSRPTFYKWYKRWEKSKGQSDALSSIKPQFDRKDLKIKPEFEKEILSTVAQNPGLSKYRIAEELPKRIGQSISAHGVYNVLLRNGLNLPESRFAYAQSFAPPVVAAPHGWTNRLRATWEEFVPNVLPAPPPFD